MKRTEVIVRYALYARKKKVGINNIMLILYKLLTHPNILRDKPKLKQN